MKKTNKEGIVQQSDTHTHILPYIDNKNKFYIIFLVQRTCHKKTSKRRDKRQKAHETRFEWIKKERQEANE